eukprot:6937794-Prorocentrum_lima.AAC.1
MPSTFLPRAGDPVLGSRSRSRDSSRLEDTVSVILPLPKDSPRTPTRKDSPDPPSSPEDSTAQSEVSAE